MRIRTSILLLFVIVVFVTLNVVCNKDEVAELEEKIVPVEMAEVQKEAIALPVHGSGMLFSKEQIRLSFKTGGIVETIHVREGERVRQGQRLAQLDLDEIEAQVQQAQSAYEKAQRDFERAEALYADGVVTLEQKQNAETQRRVAKANLEIAEFNLEYSTIKAPTDGTILKRFVEPNELVGPGTPVFYFGAGREEWLMRVGLADRDIIKISMGDPARVRFDAYPDIEFSARVIEVAQAADPQNGTFEVELLLESGGRRLAAGFVGQVTITPSKQESHTLVPVSAVVEAWGHRAVMYTSQQNSAVKVPVTIGPIVEDRVIVLSGLEQVTSVITTGAPYVRAGDRLSIQ